MKSFYKIFSTLIVLTLAACSGGYNSGHDENANGGGTPPQTPSVLMTGVWMTSSRNTLLYLKENNTCEEYVNTDLSSGTYTHKYIGGADYSYEYGYLTFYESPYFTIPYDTYVRRYTITELTNTTLRIKELFDDPAYDFVRKTTSDVPLRRDLGRLLLAGCAWYSKNSNCFYFRDNNSVEYWPNTGRSANKGTFYVSGNKLICNFTSGEYKGVYEFTISAVNDNANDILINGEKFRHWPLLDIPITQSEYYEQL